MLTEAEYNDLWVKNFTPIVGRILIPDYDQYIIRENMFQDYLDIFRGFNSRNIRLIQPNLWIYEHPFFDNNGNLKLNKVPKIKYILIAEAAPKIIDDNIIKYIYNTNLNGGQYITAPMNAFGINTNNTVDRLLSLASKGALIIDLFPFALEYTNLRDIIINYRIDANFWQSNENPYSMNNRLHQLKNENLTSEKIIGSFIAPATISINLSNFIYISYLSHHGITFDWRPIEFACVGQSRSNTPNSQRIKNGLGL
ncbi:MAG: hypothetical protein ACOYOV_10940 [Bacteroidales bacterium]